MQTILVVVHLLLAIGVVTLVLLQHGKGADAGAAFGSGASATVFGARGATSFLSRTTAILAALFFVTSLALAYFASQTGQKEALMDRVPAALPELPATPAGPPSDVPVAPLAPPPGSASDVPSAPVVAPKAEEGKPAEEKKAE